MSEATSIDLINELATAESVSITNDQAREIFTKVGGRPRELINAVQTFASGGSVEVSKEEQLKEQMKDLVGGILDGKIDRPAWDNLWTSFLGLLGENDDNAEGLRRMVLWWLWMYAENKNGWARKYRLTRIMDVMDIFSNPIEGEDAKYQFAIMMFRAWKHDNSN